MNINAVYHIWDLPWVWLTTGSKNWGQLENKTDKPAYLLAHPMWHFGLKSVLHYHRERRRLKKRNIHLIMLNNTDKENRFCNLWGLKGVCINHNIHCCEHIFCPTAKQKSKYEAIYIAAAAKYKRLELAARIKKLFVVTYFWPDIRDENGLWDLHAFEPRVQHCDFNRDRIPPTAVNEKINESDVGLALSAKEGAMFASMEYLLAGRPVVSTPSLGGRDFFFDNRYVEIVEPKPEAVLKGVNRLRKKRLDPAFIRAETLKKASVTRKAFFELVCKLSQAHNGNRPPPLRHGNPSPKESGARLMALQN